jgi:hypothetical protein
MKDYQVHDCFSLFNPILQQLGGMQYGPTNACLSLSYKQPKNPKSAINLEILL